MMFGCASKTTKELKLLDENTLFSAHPVTMAAAAAIAYDVLVSEQISEWYAVMSMQVRR